MADFPFILDEPVPSTPTSSATSTQGIVRKLSDVFGFGLDSPFRRGASDFVAVGGYELINAHIAQILGTRAGSDSATGELPWRSSFGSLLYKLRHANNDAIRAELAKQYTADAIARWEPRVRVVSVDVDQEKDTEGNQTILTIRIAYVLRKAQRSKRADVFETTYQTAS